MKSFYFLSLLFISSLLFGCKTDKIAAKSDVIGTWKLIEEKIASAIIIGQPYVFEPIQSNKTITFSIYGTFSSNGMMCQPSQQSSNQSTGFFYESLNSIEPEGCQISAPTSGISYELIEDTLYIDYPSIEGYTQKYSRL